MFRSRCSDQTHKNSIPTPQNITEHSKCLHFPTNVWSGDSFSHIFVTDFNSNQIDYLLSSLNQLTSNLTPMA